MTAGGDGGGALGADPTLFAEEAGIEVRITRMRDGTTDLADKARHDLGLETEIVVAADVKRAAHAETVKDNVVDARFPRGPRRPVVDDLDVPGHTGARTRKTCRHSRGSAARRRGPLQALARDGFCNGLQGCGHGTRTRVVRVGTGWRRWIVVFVWLGFHGLAPRGKRELEHEHRVADAMRVAAAIGTRLGVRAPRRDAIAMAGGVRGVVDGGRSCRPDGKAG